MSSAWGNSFGVSWGVSWGSIVTVQLPSANPTGLGGGGSGIDYQVARRHGPAVDKVVKRLVDVTELELIIKTLTGETASYKMVYDTDKIIAPFSNVEHPEVDDVDMQALSEDTDAVAALMEVWKRYNEKRRELLTKLHNDNYDWEEKP